MHTSLISSPPDFQGLVAHVTYQIAGFDRLNFVSDIANTVPQDGGYTIQALSFEGNGIQASGLLTVQMQEEHRRNGIQASGLLTVQMQEEHRRNGFLVQRLRSVRGMVSVREV